jgi:hypothetical protein
MSIAFVRKKVILYFTASSENEEKTHLYMIDHKKLFLLKNRTAHNEKAR